MKTLLMELLQQLPLHMVDPPQLVSVVSEHLAPTSCVLCICLFDQVPTYVRHTKHCQMGGS